VRADGQELERGKRMTTPFEREILTHHYTSPAPFPRPTDLYWATVNRFCDLGLLRRSHPYPSTDDPSVVLPVDEPMRLYMDALAAVPLPVKKWAIP
jgi:hypothetical protein